MRRAIVVGCGNPLRGDDGVGIAAVRLLRERLRQQDESARQPDWRLELVEADGPGLALLDLLVGAAVALIVDAIATGAPPGTIHRLDGAALAAANGQQRLSSHHAGLATALALGRALFPEQWPSIVAIWGIEPASVRLGDPLSPPVAAALAKLVAHLHEELGSTSTIKIANEQGTTLRSAVRSSPGSRSSTPRRRVPSR